MSRPVYRMSICRLIGVAALLALCLVARPARASEELRKELRDLAAEVKKALDGESKNEVAIGQFTGPTTFPSSSGPGIVQVLTEELQRVGIAVKVRADFGIKGAFAVAQQPAADADDARIGKKVLAIKLSATLVDGFDNPVGTFNFNRTIRGEATFLELLPLPVSLPPKAREVDRDQEIRKAFGDRTRKFAGSVVRTNPKSPYAIEVLVGGEVAKRPGQPFGELQDATAREVKTEEGLPFVPIRRGEAYAVRLINDSAFDAAVQIRIDGLSMFSFSELRHKAGAKKGEPLYTALIVPAKSSAIIPGWHVSNEKSDRFLVTEYAKSASAGLRPTAALGTISATFQAAWEKGKEPPDEPGRTRSPGSGDATGRGPRIDKAYREVQREMGVIRDVIAVRYTLTGAK